MSPIATTRCSPSRPLASEDSAYRNATTSALLHRETAVTAFQYPFALNGQDCQPQPEWTKKLLHAIGELNGVAGNHARSYFEMAPASVSIRLTDRLVAGYETYHFKLDKRGPDNQRRISSCLVTDLLDPELDLPGGEFHLGGQIVRDMDDSQKAALRDRGVTLDADAARLLDAAATKLVGGAG